MLSVNLFLPPFQIVGLAILKIKQSVLDIQMSETCRLHLALEDYLNQKFVNRWIAVGGRKLGRQDRSYVRISFREGCPVSGTEDTDENQFLSYPVLRRFHRVTQIDFSTECDIVLSPSILSLLRLSSSCLPLIPRLLVTYLFPSTLPSITSVRKQFLREMGPIRLGFLFLLFARR